MEALTVIPMSRLNWAMTKLSESHNQDTHHIYSIETFAGNNCDVCEILWLFDETLRSIETGDPVIDIKR